MSISLLENSNDIEEGIKDIKVLIENADNMKLDINIFDEIIKQSFK